MLTVKTMMNQVTNVKHIMEGLTDTLRTIDPVFEDEETQFCQVLAYLTQEADTVESNRVKEYVAAREEELAMELIYIGWQGFQLNMEIFQKPVVALMLREDYEDLHMERRLCTLPTARKACEYQSAFWAEARAFPEDQKALFQIVDDYFSYLQTAGYKLAHYFGFRLADQFLPYVMPGYISDPLNTSRYLRKIENNLQADLAYLG